MRSGTTPLGNAATAMLKAINKPMPFVAGGAAVGLGAGAYLGGRFMGRVLGGPRVETNEGVVKQAGVIGAIGRAVGKIPKIIGKGTNKIPSGAIGNAAIGTTAVGAGAAAASKKSADKPKKFDLLNHLYTKSKPGSGKYASYTRADIIMEKEAAVGTAIKAGGKVLSKLIPKSKAGKAYLGFDIASPGRSLWQGAGRAFGAGKKYKAPKGNAFDEWVLGGLPLTKSIGNLFR